MPKTIRDEIIWVISWSYSLLTQGEKRQFGGSAPGKGRRPEVVAIISSKLAQRLDYALTMTTAGKSATAGGIAVVIEKSLIAITPGDAYRTLERSAEQPEKARLDLAGKLADGMLQVFDIAKKPVTGIEPYSMQNGPGQPKEYHRPGIGSE